MPDKRQHRGAHPEDEKWFAPSAVLRLREAVTDFAWLLGRDYATAAALKLVGDRYQLAERQRLAVMRSSCSDASLAYRQARQIASEALRGQAVWIDGYNVLTTVEVALAGGVVLMGRDGCYRDVASMHGTFRKVEETRPALGLIMDYLSNLGPREVVWYFDSPVSNSGRLKGLVLEMAAAAPEGTDWRVELVNNPDPLLAAADVTIVTTDSVILDRCQAWFNLAREVIVHTVIEYWLIDLAV